MNYKSTSKTTTIFIVFFAALLALWALASVWDAQPEIIVVDRQTIINQTIIQPTVETITTSTVVEKMVGYTPVADCVAIGSGLEQQESYTLKCYNRLGALEQ
jgi:hypothetical protein